MQKVCLIYANCQNKLVAQYLYRSEQFIQEYQIYRFPVHNLIEKQSTIPEELLSNTALFIYQPVKDSHGDHSTQSILNRLPANCITISFPSLYFTGYFPQYCKNPHNHILKPNYPYGIIPQGDSNIISLQAAGKSRSEITAILSNPDFYSSDFVRDNLNRTLEELARRELSLNIKISNFIRENYQNYYLFHTQNHPTDIIGIYLVNQILRLLEFPLLKDQVYLDHPTRGILDSLQIPIYPSVIKHLNLKFVDGNTVYRHSNFATNVMTFARYIAEYIELNTSSLPPAQQAYFDSITLTKQHQLPQAINKLQESITIQPKHSFYYGELGNLYLQQNKLDDAKAAYKQAIILSPTWEEYYQSLAEVLVKQGKIDAARLLYQKALEINPLCAKTHRHFGDFLKQQNQLEAAEAIYKQAINLDSINAFNYRCLGDLFKQKQKWDSAISNYQLAISLSPKTAYLHDNLRQILTKKNQHQKGIKISQQLNSALQSNHQNILLQQSENLKMKTRFIAILSMPRNGTNYLCDLVGKFQEIDSLYEIYHGSAVYINHQKLTKNIIQHINQVHQLPIQNYRDPQLVNFVAQHPQLFLDILSSYSTNQYLSFKVFPNHLSQEQLKNIILHNKRIKKIIVKRNLLDVYFSVQFARTIQQWDRKDTSNLKVDFNPENFIKWFERHTQYYEFIEQELKISGEEINILDYEKIHSFDNNQEKFIYMFNFLRSLGIKLDQENLFQHSPAELNQNIRQKQDKRSSRLEKVTNPQLLLNTLEQNHLESLLV